MHRLLHRTQIASLAADSKERNYKDEVQRLVSEQAASAALIVKQKETIAELRASLDTARAQRGDGKSEGSAGSSSNSGGPGFLSSTSSAGASGNDLDSLLRAFLGQEAAAAAAPSPTSAPGSSPSSTSEASSNPSPASASAPNPRACYPAAVGPDLLLLLRHFKDKLSALAVAKAAAEGQLAKLASDVSALTTELKESKEASDKVVWDAQALLGVNERLSERVKAQAESLAALQKAELALQVRAGRSRVRESTIFLLFATRILPTSTLLCTRLSSDLYLFSSYTLHSEGGAAARA